MASAVSTGVSRPGGVDALTVQDAKINKAIKQAARAIVPVYKNIPIPVLYRESGLLPIAVLLE